MSRRRKNPWKDLYGGPVDECRLHVQYMTCMLTCPFLSANDISSVVTSSEHSCVGVRPCLFFANKSAPSCAKKHAIATLVDIRPLPLTSIIYSAQQTHIMRSTWKSVPGLAVDLKAINLLYQTARNLHRNTNPPPHLRTHM